MSNTIKLGIFIPTYNAGKLLNETLRRIPIQDKYEVEILISDDASTLPMSNPGNYANLVNYKLTVIKQEKNLGYGGNQKFGFCYGMEKNWDALVLLHGDGQYAPEILFNLVDKLFDSNASLVFGSRMQDVLGALKGGMPKYKYLGNRILTFVQNRLAGLRLSEWHSGYRVYRIETIKELCINQMSNGFDFDTQIILGLLQNNSEIQEMSIPTYYGDEISHVNGIKYAWQIVKHSIKFAKIRYGFSETPSWLTKRYHYPEKRSAGSSHEMFRSWTSKISPRSILDIGSGESPWLCEKEKREFNIWLTGIDLIEPQNLSKFDEFYKIEVEKLNSINLKRKKYDLIVLGDLLEHLVNPKDLVKNLSSFLEYEGKIIVSVPNINHWYVKLRILSGKFGYDQRGILDETHLRFFTPKTISNIFFETGYQLERYALSRFPMSPWKYRTLFSYLHRRNVRGPNFFGYQAVLQFRKRL